MPQRPNLDQLISIATIDADRLDRIRGRPQPLSESAHPDAEIDAIPNDMWLVIDGDQPVISYRQQILDAWEIECCRIGMAVAGHG